MAAGGRLRSPDVLRARQFEMALTKGYAGYCWRSMQPGRLEIGARRLEKIGFISGLLLLLYVVPWMSQLLWSDQLRASLGPISNYVFVALFIACMGCFSAAFIMDTWRNHRSLSRS